MNNFQTEMYQSLLASHCRDFNRCFYCGCVATKSDYAPPIKFAEFYITTRENADFFEVPCCYECHEFLIDSRSGLLAERFDIVKRRIAKKYKKPIRIFEVWNDSDSVDLGYNLKNCINAGLALGQEAYERLKYEGFDFSVNGAAHEMFFIKKETFSVFDEKFSSFREALDSASRAYRIPKGKLKELYADHQNNFDNAINSYHEELKAIEHQKKLNNLCNDFAKQHKQNPKFIIKTIEYYMSEDDELSIEMALKKLKVERFS